LDLANPWFCPTCRRNQTATNTLSVWRYPDYLVIYLKRFVYLEMAWWSHWLSQTGQQGVLPPVSGVNTQHMPSIARLISGTISMIHRVPEGESQDADYVLFYKRRRRATLLLQCAAVPFAA
jgi:ubiquitin C-terminal hydrolase